MIVSFRVYGFNIVDLSLGHSGYHRGTNTWYPAQLENEQKRKIMLIKSIYNNPNNTSNKSKRKHSPGGAAEP